MNRNLFEYTANFQVKGDDLLSFCDCLSLLRNNIGFVALGAEDLFTVFEKGSTEFYTATAENIASAIEFLKLKLNVKTSFDYTFFILFTPKEQLLDIELDNTIGDFSKYISSHEFWFQIYPKERSSVSVPVSLPCKRVSYDELDIESFCSQATVYLLTNKR